MRKLLAATLLAGLALTTAKADPPPDIPKLYAPPLPLPGDRAERVFPGGVKLFGDIT